MKVKCVLPEGKFGFYGGIRRYTGDGFNIDKKHFSDKWMEKVTSRRNQEPEAEQTTNETLEGGE